MNEQEKIIFNRTERLLGESFMDAISQKKVIIFGVGGVGSWCAEGLVRSGIKHLTIVDSDCVSATNINRQMMATTATVGKVKVDELKKRLLEINPFAEITAIQDIFCQETAESFHLQDFDYIIDCIDSLKDKAQLILSACATDAKFYSSMGAALKLDPTRIKTGEFWSVQGCPLARMLRKRFKKNMQFPRRKFTCVYSDELLSNEGLNPIVNDINDCNSQEGREELKDHNWNESKAQINGSLVHITAIFGFHLTSLVMMDINSKKQK